VSAYRLDAEALYEQLDEHRQERGLSWRAVGRENDLSPNVLSRLKRGTSPDAHAVLTLLAWLDSEDSRPLPIKPKEAA
jgi:transcriptional regulator with XRE-family HTH domain